MTISKIVQNSIDETSVSLGVKITNVQVANSSYTVLDDTAVNVGGGYIVITGNGFKSNPQVLIGQNTACSITFIDSTTIRAEVPAKDAGTYPIYVVNTDGAVGIRVPGLTYSGFPTWVTGSTLTDQSVDEAISIQLEATGANTYALQTGSTLPTGMVLNTANGLLSGTVTGVEEDTLYNFTIEAIDTENQESPRAFNVTIVVGEEYFNRTVLLLNGDGTSGANNNVFRDSSNNNFAITRNGNTTQGTFTPFSAPDGRWSVYFGGNQNATRLSCGSHSIGTSDFQVEAWIWVENYSDFQGIFATNIYNTNNSFHFRVTSSTGLLMGWVASGGTYLISSASAVPTNQWVHVVFMRQSGTAKMYINGVLEADTEDWSGVNIGDGSASTHLIGTYEYTNNNYYEFHGYISNLRYIIGTPTYSSNFTPSTEPFTTTSQGATASEVKVLACQSNRFVDNSNSPVTIIPYNDVKVTPFSPFAPTAAYSAATNGGSAYFRGASNADGLTVASNTAFNLSNGNFTVEAWVYPTATFTVSDHGIFSIGENVGTRKVLQFNGYGTNKVRLSLSSNGSSYDLVDLQDATTVNLNSWAHLAVVRNGATVTVWKNGSNVAAFGVSTSSLFNDTELGVSVGNYRNSGSLTSSSFPGYISGVRLLKGTALYTTAFTPPTEPSSPIADTQLILNSINAGILDYTAKNVIETVADAQIDTAVKKYGTGSMQFDGTDDALTSGFSPNLLFNSGDFTAEAWIYPESLTDGRSIVGVWGTIGQANDASWLLYINGSNILWYVSTDGSTQTAAINVAHGMSINNWYHVALARANGTTKIFIDGVQVGQTTTAYTLFNSTSGIVVGRNPIGGTPDVFQGYIDDLRITKGVARYTTTFTPPTSAHRKR